MTRESRQNGPAASRLPAEAIARDRFPKGWLSFLTEDERLAKKLRDLARNAGILRSFDGATLRVQVDAGQQDEACSTFGASLDPAEQDAVFLLLEAPSYPQLRSLRSVLARCRYVWLPELLDSGSWSSHFQAIFDLETGEAFGFEALLRAKHRSGTAVSPTEILAAARETGRLAVVDERAQQASFTSAAEHLRPADRLFVNVDVAGLAGGPPDVERLIALAGRFGRRPESVVFELLESEGLAAAPNLSSIRELLGAAGFRVALDDLTSGFSTLAVLDRIRPDIAKLDQRLVAGAHADRFRGRLVKAFVDLCRDLDLLLVVEGVETEGDQRFVRDLGVRYAQGYFLARPAAEPLRRIVVESRPGGVSGDDAQRREPIADCNRPGRSGKSISEARRRTAL